MSLQIWVLQAWREKKVSAHDLDSSNGQPEMAKWAPTTAFAISGCR